MTAPDAEYAELLNQRNAPFDWDAYWRARERNEEYWS